MKHRRLIALTVFAFAALVAVSCSGDNRLFPTDGLLPDEGGMGGGVEDMSGYSEGEVTTFTVAFDRESLNETLTVDSSDDDYVENTTFDQTISIRFGKDGDASIEGDTDGIVTVRGNDVTVNNTGKKTIIYELSGETSDGFFKVYGAKKQAIKLNGVSITNPDGAAINNQNKKRTFIIAADGTTNFLADGTEYSDKTDDEDMKGTLFSEAQLIFSGTGDLEIDANTKAGISSDDYVRIMPGANIYIDASAGNGIKAKDAYIATGGVVNINVTATASKGISTDGYAQFDGGRTTLVTSGGGEYDEKEQDASACAGVKADSTLTVNGGEIRCLSSGQGGKGLSTDQEAYFNGGTVRIITTGTKYTYSSSADSSPKGIKADGDLHINGGHIMVRATGGEGSEGIESKGDMTISGGVVEVHSYDDGINCSGDLKVTGGHVYSRGTRNDGLDANKNIYIEGGVVVAVGATMPEVPIDAAEGYNIYINGGVVAAFGASIAQTSSSSKQASVTTTATGGTKVGLFDSDNSLLYFEVPSISNLSAVMLSAPSLKSGNSYTVKTGVTNSGGTSFHGLSTDGTVSGGSGSTSVTASAQVGSGMGGGFGGPGGGPRW